MIGIGVGGLGPFCQGCGPRALIPYQETVRYCHSHAQELHQFRYVKQRVAKPEP